MEDVVYQLVTLDDKLYQQLVVMADMYETTVELLLDDIIVKGIKRIEESR